MTDDEVDLSGLVAFGGEEPPGISLVNGFLIRMIEERVMVLEIPAVDGREGSVIRGRSEDGEWSDFAQVPEASLSRVVNRLKVMSAIDPIAHLDPRTGGFAVKLRATEVNFETEFSPKGAGGVTRVRLRRPGPDQRSPAVHSSRLAERSSPAAESQRGFGDYQGREERTMSDAEDIRARRDVWLAAFVAEDIPAMSDFVTEDHVAMPPNQPQRSGLEAAKEFWQEGFSAAKTTMAIHPQELTVSGDVAIDRFDWEMRITPRGEGTTLDDKGGCLWIWRRGEDGSWRIATAIWNSDLAEPGVWSGG